MAQNTNNRPIIVGGKNTANYALAVAHRVGEGQTGTIVLRARGRFVSAAFDAANKACNMGLSLSRGNVRWGQEQGPKGPCSWVEIDLTAAAA